MQGDGQGRNVGELLDADDARGLLGGAAPRNAVRREERNSQSVSGGIDAIGDEAKGIGADINGHGFFEPRNALGTHADGNGERAAPGSGGERLRRGLAGVGRTRVGRGVQGTFEMDGDGDAVVALVALVAFGAEDASQDFRLPVGLRGIVGKRDPEGHADAVVLVAREKEASAGSVARFALLDFLAERRGPTKPDRQAKVNPAIETSRHVFTRRANWLG